MRYFVCSARFEMGDGRTLAVSYGARLTPGGWGGPEEWDIGEPTYTLEGKEVELSDLPKGLDVIAEKLYNAGPGEFHYKQARI